MFTTHLASGDSDVYPAFLAPPFGMYKTDLYHLLGQATPILDMWWHMFLHLRRIIHHIPYKPE
jgi:hypothetical protein